MLTKNQAWATALMLCSGLALAQTKQPVLEPLPDVPPPPAMAMDPDLEPQVVIRKQGEDTVAEYRIQGKLYMMKVTPPHGVPYYLIDTKGDGSFSRIDNASPMPSVPMWVLHSW